MFVFSFSNNFVRLCIVQVFKESRKHLDKLHNVDEFIARIFQVVHSNDPVSRAITIRSVLIRATMGYGSLFVGFIART